MSKTSDTKPNEKSEPKSRPKPGSKIAAGLANIFRLRFWLDVERITGFTQYVKQLAQKLFVLQESKVGESFDEATARFKLTDEVLAKREQALLRVSFLMLMFTICLVGYSVYQMIYGSILGVILSLVVACIALALAFRYHFWHFQIKAKKLGCSWQVWLSEGFRGGKKS